MDGKAGPLRMARSVTPPRSEEKTAAPVPRFERAKLVKLARTVGLGAEIVDLMPDPAMLVPYLLRDIPGPEGSRLRLEWYAPLFGHLGSEIRFGAGVTFLNPEAIKLGDKNFVDDGVYLDARSGYGIETGENVRICNGAYLVPHQAKGYIRIGSNSYIGARSQVFGHGGVEIGDYVLAAPGLMIVPYQHEFGDKEKMIAHQGGETGVVAIEDDVYLGQSVKVLHGVRIGKGSVIGAGSVVTKDVAPYTVVAGVPARALRKRGE